MNVRSLLLVFLNIHCPDGKKTDKEESDSVAEKHDAAKSAVDVRVRTLAQSYIGPLVTLKGKMRAAFDKLTAVWEAKRWRVLKAEQYNTLMAVMRPMQQEFDDLVEKMLNEYSLLRAESEKQAGTFFDPEEFPSRKKLRRQYSTRVTKGVITDPESDIRVQGFTEHQNAELRKDVMAEVMDKLRGSTDELLARIQELVADVHDRMGADGAKYGTLVDKLKGTVPALRTLNFTDDPEINRILDTLEKIGWQDSDEIREKSSLQSDNRKRAAEMLETLKTLGVKEKESDDDVPAVKAPDAAAVEVEASKARALEFA